MTTYNIPETVRSLFTALENRIYELERRLGQTNVDNTIPRLEVPFTMSGLLTVDTSEPFYPRVKTVLTSVCPSLRVAGSSTTTVKLYKGSHSVAATLQGSFSLMSGQTFLTTSPKFNIKFNGVDEYLLLETSAVGVNATGLDCQVRFG